MNEDISYKFQYKYINIDSKNRNIHDKIIYKHKEQLPDNCISILNGKINLDNNKCDKIKFKPYSYKNLRSIVNKKPIIESIKDTDILKIYCNHNFELNCDLDIYIEISNLQFYENIGLDLLCEKVNGRYKLYTYIEGFESSNEWFYIKIYKTINKKLIIKDSTIKLLFDYGLLFNSSFEEVELSLNENINLKYNLINIGLDIYIYQIDHVIKGFPNSNNYKYYLDETLFNVVSVELINTIIPRVNYNDRKFYLNKCLFKWLNNNIVEYIEIELGYYDIYELFSIINKNKYNVMFNILNVADKILISTNNNIILNDDNVFKILKKEYFDDKIKYNLILKDNDYILMKINDLDIIHYDNKSYFAKINLFGSNEFYYIDSFVRNNKIFKNPINSINELFIEFYDCNHKLYDFNLCDHSFVLKIITIDEFINNTQLTNITESDLYNSKSNKNIVIAQI